jgi:UDP-N-acetyl-D-glucosamine dehydrogenase
MNQHAKALREKIASRKARLGVVGLGYVGLPLAVEFAQVGFRVTGIDVDAAKVDNVKRGRSHVEDIPDAVLGPLVRDGLIGAQADYKGCGKFDAVFIAVPTPLRKTRDPDISYIVNSLEQIVKEVRPGQLIVLESTTYPGTTEEILRPALEAGGLRVGEDLFLAFSPERVDPGNQRFTTKNTPKVVGGCTELCTEIAAELYGQAIETVHPVSSSQAAEMIKLLENTFRAVNIALVNEIAIMCERLKLDVWEVIDGAATKPFGFMRFYPGPGIGGHCIPLDPHYLSWKLRTLNYSARFIELAGEINREMPHVVVRRATALLNEKKKSVNGANVLVLGVAYKKDVGDLRESPAIDVVTALHELGAKVAYHDPHVPEMRLENGTVLRSVPWKRGLAKADLAILVTDHSSFDYDALVAAAPLVLDTRNATRAVARGRGKIHKL